jgi:hypothetical protein
VSSSASSNTVLKMISCTVCFSEDPERDKQMEQKSVAKVIAVPEGRQLLLDELTCPQKKPLSQPTTLDLVTDCVDLTRETSSRVDVSSFSSLSEHNEDIVQHAQMNIDTEGYLPETVHSASDFVEKDEQDNECRANNKKLETGKRKENETANRSSTSESKKIKYDDSQVMCVTEYIVNEPPSIPSEKGILTMTPVIPEVLSSDPNDQEQQTLPLEFSNDLSVPTHEVIVVASSDDGTPISKADCGGKKIEADVMTEAPGCGMKWEYAADPTTMNLYCKNIDLEQNRKKVNLFGIKMPGNTCDTFVSRSDVKVTHNNNRIDKLLPTLQKSDISSHRPSVPISRGFSTYMSPTSAEYLSYPHEVAVTKCSGQKRGLIFPSANPKSKEPLPPSVNSKLPCTLSKASVPQLVPCYQNGKFLLPIEHTQQLGSHDRAVELNSSQANLSVSRNRIHTKYPGKVFDPHQPLNVQRQVKLHSYPRNFRQFDCTRNMQLAASVPGISHPSNTGIVGSICSVDSSYKSMAECQTLQNNRHWVMKPSGSIQQVQEHPWHSLPAYGQYPVLRHVAQQSVSLLLLLYVYVYSFNCI